MRGGARTLRGVGRFAAQPLRAVLDAALPAATRRTTKEEEEVADGRASPADIDVVMMQQHADPVLSEMSTASGGRNGGGGGGGDWGLAPPDEAPVGDAAVSAGLDAAPQASAGTAPVPLAAAAVPRAEGVAAPPGAGRGAHASTFAVDDAAARARPQSRSSKRSLRSVVGSGGSVRGGTVTRSSGGGSRHTSATAARAALAGPVVGAISKGDPVAPAAAAAPAPALVSGPIAGLPRIERASKKKKEGALSPPGTAVPLPGAPLPGEPPPAEFSQVRERSVREGLPACTPLPASCPSTAVREGCDGQRVNLPWAHWSDQAPLRARGGGARPRWWRWQGSSGVPSRSQRRPGSGGWWC